MVFDFIPQPKTKTWRIINLMVSVTFVVAALFYILSGFDLIPDALGPIGYIDDIIVLILGLVFLNNFIKRISERWSTSKTVYKELWRKGDLIGFLGTFKFWASLVIIGGVVAYFIWAIDLIPDTLPGGFTDDIVVAITGAYLFVKLWLGKRK